MSRHFPKHGMRGSKCIRTHHFEPAPHPAECLGRRHLVWVLNRRQCPLAFKKECLLWFTLRERNLKSSIGWSKILKSYMFVSPKVFLDQAWSYSLEQRSKTDGSPLPPPMNNRRLRACPSLENDKQATIRLDWLVLTSSWVILCVCQTPLMSRALAIQMIFCFSIKKEILFEENQH